MAIPIAPHTISLASLFLLLLLASALQPGLMAAPLSVAVQTPPIEQNIERRELELKIYARRMVKHPSKLEVVQTNTLQPNEWLEIILGKEQILDIVAKSKNEWRIDPAKLPSPYSIKTDTEIHSTFLIGTVYFPSLFIKEKLFGGV
ncbi:hypothetical protein EV361DRAFT_422456 [Lentinula raphanica]|nr:hypothetical protein EV361DRAFT_422456 [Lentinula raphanica]